MARRHDPLDEHDDLLRVTGTVIKYGPRGGAKEIFTCKAEEILMSGPAGTGKSLACLHKLHLCMSKYSGARAFMARKTRTSMTNSCLTTFDNHVLKKQDNVYFHKGDQQYNYPNGSVVAVIGLDNPERIKSTEWDMGYVQEVTECTENDWEICTTRLRNGVMPYQQALSDCNPDKPNHWIKKRAELGLITLIKSELKDNPRWWSEALQDWTPQGRQYIGKLDRLSGVRRKRLYLGEWVQAEGVVYEGWDEQIHMITLNELPEGWQEWTHYWTIDFGYTHPFVWQDWIEHPQTLALYRLAEIYRTKTLVEDHARRVMELTYGVSIPHAIICDHDAEDRATFERHTGYLTLPAYKAIQVGIQAMQNRLRPGWNGQPRPGIFFVRDALVEVDRDLLERGLPTCTEQEFDGYVWDEKISRIANSKRDELPLDKDDHGCDASRYMVAFADSLADDPEEFEAVMVNDDHVRISPY